MDEWCYCKGLPVKQVISRQFNGYLFRKKTGKCLKFIGVIIIIGILYKIQVSQVPRILHDLVNYDATLFQSEIKKSNGGHKIVIMTSYRSGSSFIGSIFAHFPSTFYMFEPLMFLSFQETTEYTDYFLKHKLSYYLDNIVNCNLRILEKDSVKYFSSYKQKRMRYQWTRRAFPIPGLETHSRLSLHHRGYKSFSKAQAGCESRQNVVAKVIRAHLLSNMVCIMMKNISIVNLIRDPRGLFSSRLKIRNVSKSALQNNSLLFQSIRENVRSKCITHNKNYEFLKKYIVTNTTLRTKYLVLRYEDFAIDPLKMTEKLYDYFNIDKPKSLPKWIEKKTSKSVKVRDSRYTTVKESKNTARDWLKHLPFSYISMIQDECKEFMHNFGYKFINNKSFYKQEDVLHLEELADDIPHL